MISTTNIPSGGSKLQKTLQPGNCKIKINKVYLEDFPYGTDAYNLMLDCEGEDLGPDFEGFFVDKDDESLGRYAGQVGRVRASRWAYEDKNLPNNVVINRDIEITKFLKNICDATDCADWLIGEDGQHETIESLVNKFNEDAPYADKYLYACLAGKEYENKQGYVNYDLYFPKFTREGIPFEAEDAGSGRVYKYNETDHIIKRKVKEVDSFEANEQPSKEFEV
jgi:hypothetical protein